MQLGWVLRGLVALAAVAGLGGCFEESPDQRARAVCTAYCECFVTSGAVEQCVVDECLPELPPVSDECLDCVVQNSQTCSLLGDQCTELCIDDSQP